MPSAFEWMMALRYLRARRREGFISVITWFSLTGIALGVATLIIVMAVMNGFRQELMSRILGINGHLNVYGAAGALVDYQSLAATVAGVPGVVAVAPMVEGQVMTTARRIARGALVRGMRPEDVRDRPILAEHIVGGTLDEFKGDDALLVGARLASQLGLGVGDRMTLVAPQGAVTAFGTVPRMRSYRIAALFEVGMHEYDSTFVFMPLEAAQVYFQMPGAVTSLEVIVERIDRAEAVAADVQAAIGPAGRVLDWQRANASFFNAIQVERNVMFLILTLIILVAAFNIVSSLIMLVKDKGRDIAILRTIGATRATIMRVFLIAGASIGVTGTLAGFGLGLAFSLNIETIRQWIQGLTGAELFAAEIYFLSQLPAKVEASEVLAVVGMGLGLSFLATLYPSWRAAHVEPAEALRYE